MPGVVRAVGSHGHSAHQSCSKLWQACPNFGSSPHNYGYLWDGPLLAAGETLDVEFKRRLGKDDLYQAVVCMANGIGGRILVGVDDDGTVVGTTADHDGAVDADLLAGRIQNGIEPPLSVDVEVVPWEGKDVAVITVPQAKSSSRTPDPTVWKRMRTCCFPC